MAILETVVVSRKGKDVVINKRDFVDGKDKLVGAPKKVEPVKKEEGESAEKTFLGKFKTDEKK